MCVFVGNANVEFLTLLISSACEDVCMNFKRYTDMGKSLMAECLEQLVEEVIEKSHALARSIIKTITALDFMVGGYSIQRCRHCLISNMIKALLERSKKKLTSLTQGAKVQTLSGLNYAQGFIGIRRRPLFSHKIPRCKHYPVSVII